MTWDERVKAIADHGFTERQAGFLVTVMLHSGVCLGRHYSAFARITHGQKVQDFFRKVVARKYATARRCGHNRARLSTFITSRCTKRLVSPTIAIAGRFL